MIAMTALEFVAWYLAAVAGAAFAVLVIAWRSRRAKRASTTITISTNLAGMVYAPGMLVEHSGLQWKVTKIEGSTITLRPIGPGHIPRRTS